MTFAPGDHVVCIDAKPRNGVKNYLVEGQTYIVATPPLSVVIMGDGIMLEGDASWMSYYSDRFVLAASFEVDIQLYGDTL